MQSSKPCCEELKEDVTRAVRTVLAGLSKRDFFPKVLIQKLLSPSVIDQVLRCKCQSCNDQRTSATRHSVKEVRDWIVNGSYQCFALLTYAGCPQLVDGFYQRKYNDERVLGDLRSLNAELLSRSFWPHFDSRDNGRSHYFAKQVADHKYQFFVPTLDLRGNTELLKFDAEILIPIAEEEKLGEGIGGKVYAINLVEGYYQLPSDSELSLVRKEVEYSSSSKFPEELDILLHVRHLLDDGNSVHVVKLIAAYQHGNKINYIFPRATTNLDHYLRNQESSQGLKHFAIEKHPLWKQTLGIFRALQLLHGDMYQISSHKPIKVYHFDLKPANVLVDVLDNMPRLLIADFGFSRSRPTTGSIFSDTKLTANGGTPTYAPPEIHPPNNQRNHQYDVWSLGCILLELCAYIVGGSQAVLELDGVRYTNETTLGNAIWEDYFWHTSGSGLPELKPSIVRWMHQLPQHLNVSSTRARDLVKEVLVIAHEMLNVDVDKRISAETAQVKLNLVLQKKGDSGTSLELNQIAESTVGSSASMTRSARLNTASSSIVASPRATRSITSNPSSEILIHPARTMTLDDELANGSDGMVPIGAMELREMGAVNCKYGGHFHDNISLSLQEDSNGVLHLQMWRSNKTTEKLELGPRDLVHLVTVQREIKAHRLDIRLSERDHPKFEVLNIYLTNTKDVATLQSVLLGQNVRSFLTAKQRSLTITSLKVEQKQHQQSRRSRLRWNLSDRDNKIVSSGDWGLPLRLELWSEKSYHDSEAYHRIMPRRKSRTLALEVPARRLVIFCQKAVLFVLFAKNERLEKPPDKYSGLVHRIIPTDQRAVPKDASFPVAVSLTGGRIPLDPATLTDLHGSSAFECSALEFSFATRRDWEAFMNKYRNMKAEWQRENTALEKDLKYGPEERGWGVQW